MALYVGRQTGPEQPQRIGKRNERTRRVLGALRIVYGYSEAGKHEILDLISFRQDVDF